MENTEQTIGPIPVILLVVFTSWWLFIVLGFIHLAGER